MKNYFASFFRYLSLCVLLNLHVNAETDIPSKSSFIRLTGHIPSKGVTNAVFLEHLNANHSVPATFVLPLRNQEALEELIQRIYDPTDQQHYGKYLTSEEFVNQFGPTQEDYDHVIAYAKKSGWIISKTHPNRTLLNVIGSTESIEKAFNISLHLYQKPDGRKFYAPNNNPEVPLSIASIISSIIGLDNYAVWRPFHHQKQTGEAFQVSKSTPHTFPSGPAGGYSPTDLLNAYNLSGISANGSGQIIALLELAGYQISDINTYTSHFALPPAKLHNILVDGGSKSGIDAEVTLDIQLAIALAPESQIYVYEGPNSNQGVLNTYNQIATDNIAQQVSTSWGMSENLVNVQYLQAENAIFMQMAAHGQTMYAAAGDSGAYDDPDNSSLAVDDPASQPYVVGVGGTMLKVNPETCTYASESVWNNGLGKGAGGGGVSIIWPIPSWQKNVSTTHSNTHRNVPDVSLNADPNTGYSIYYNGQWTIFGGTSCAAPLWAAFTALVNQERAANQKPLLGFANPLLYSIGTGPSYTSDFHDVITGNNLNYSAQVGYDNATGWGSFKGTNLFVSLTNFLSVPQPLLNITMAHSAPFTQGGVGSYQIGVTNNGNSSTSGTVSVAIFLPKGFKYRSFSGQGWTFNENTLIFTQRNPLKPGSSYPLITLNVNIDNNAPSPLIPTATVSGAGFVSSTITNLTTIK